MKKRDKTHALYNFYIDDIVEIKSAEGVKIVSGVSINTDVNVGGTYRVRQEPLDDGKDDLYTLIELTTTQVKQIQTRKENMKLIERREKVAVVKSSKIINQNMAELGKEVYEF